MAIVKPKIALTVVIVLVLAIVTSAVHHYKTKSGGDVIRVSDNTTTPSGWDLVQRLTGRDLLKEKGVKLEKVPGVATGSPPFQAVLTGQLDVAGGDWLGWINVIARGGKVKALYATSALTKSSIGHTGLLVLNESPIHSVKDLKGKAIGVNTLGLGAELVIKILLKKHGLSATDAQLLIVPDINEEQVLRSHQVDAAGGTTAGGPWFELAKARGGVRIVDGTDRFAVYGSQDTTMVGGGFREDFIRAHPDAVRRYVEAVKESQQIIWNAFQSDPEKVRKAYSDISSEKGGNPLLGQYFIPPSPEGLRVHERDIQFCIDFLIDEGKLKPGQVKPSDIYTGDFESSVLSR